MPTVIPKNGINKGCFEKGQKHTERWKEIMKVRMKGENNPSKRLEVRNKISLALKGRKFSEEWKGKLSESKLKNPTRYWLGKKRPEMTGINCPWWKGGISTYERKLYLNSRRWARKNGAIGSHTFDDWKTLKERYNFICPSCHKSEPEIKLTEDHIVPLSKGGSDDIENIQPLCKYCNSKKNIKTMRYSF